ncbi:alpha/beta fold hydrolase [Streptomyces sp. NBC_01198]|uniref:alpha/beta fold hydrolase n=1 Tax=Streptomyces sp. NBC_01198 TaxID=2903769 RepID=UPI002E123BDE|nr:alpha/beta hydrolase [Streptomyces sp. NBC_01198]
MSSEVTLALAHGAWADASSWGRVIDQVTAAGVRVVTVPLPLTSLTDDVAALDHTLERETAPVVLAGHAYAGGVIQSTTSDNVRALVYIAALAPGEGETVADAVGRGTPHPKAPALTPDAHGLIWLPDDAFAGAFAHNASPQEQNRLRAVQRPISVKCITTAVGRPLWMDRPSWYLVAEEDRMIPAGNQHFFADRMGAEVRSEPVDHMLPLTAPNVVTEFLLRVVEKVGQEQPQG